MVPQELLGSYQPPFGAKKSTVVKCLYRNTECRVTSWSKAPLSWPRVQPLNQLGGSGLWVNETLVQAIRTESAESLMWWFGVSPGVVWKWRKAFGVSGTATTPGSKKAQHAASKAGAKAIKARQWTDEERADLAKRLAVARGSIRRPRWTPERGGWTADQITLLGTDYDKVIAEKLNRTVNAVRLRRVKLGIPKFVPASQQAARSVISPPSREGESMLDVTGLEPTDVRSDRHQPPATHSGASGRWGHSVGRLKW